MILTKESHEIKTDFHSPKHSSKLETRITPKASKNKYNYQALI